MTLRLRHGAPVAPLFAHISARTPLTPPSDRRLFIEFVFESIPQTVLQTYIYHQLSKSHLAGAARGCCATQLHQLTCRTPKLRPMPRGLLPTCNYAAVSCTGHPHLRALRPVNLPTLASPPLILTPYNVLLISAASRTTLLPCPTAGSSQQRTIALSLTVSAVNCIKYGYKL